MNNSFNNSFENKEPQLMLRDNDEPDIEDDKSQHSNHEDPQQENEIPEIIIKNTHAILKTDNEALILNSITEDEIKTLEKLKSPDAIKIARNAFLKNSKNGPSKKGIELLHINFKEMNKMYDEGKFSEDLGNITHDTYNEVRSKHPHKRIELERQDNKDVVIEGEEEQQKKQRTNKKEKLFKNISCCAQVGCFCPVCTCCCKTSKDIENLGIGMLVYFKFLKSLFTCFIFITLLNIPVLLSYSNTNPSKSGYFLDSLFQTTIGNIDSSIYNCEKIDLSSLEDLDYQVELNVNCHNMTIAEINSFGVSVDSKGETENDGQCHSFMLQKHNLTLDQENCNLTTYINTQMDLNNCFGQSQCTISLDLSSETCNVPEDLNSIYFSYTCFEKELTFAVFNMKLTRSNFGLLVGGIDCLTVVILFALFIIVDNLKRKDQFEFTRSNLYIRDLTLHLTDIKVNSENIYEEFSSLVKHFEQVKQEVDPKGIEFQFIPINNELTANYNDYIDNIQIKKEKSQNFFIYDFVHPKITGDKLSYLMKIEELRMEINNINKQINDLEPKNSNKHIRETMAEDAQEQEDIPETVDGLKVKKPKQKLSPKDNFKLEKFNKDKQAKEKEIAKLEEKIKKIKENKIIKDIYITFRNHNIAYFYQAIYDKTKCQRCYGICCCNRYKYLYYKNKWLNIKFASDEPSNIRWENLTYNSCGKCCRSCLSFLLGFVIILVSLVFIFLFKNYETKVNEKYNTDINCNYYKDDSAFTNIINEFDRNLTHKERVYTYCYCLTSGILSSKSIAGRTDIVPCKDFASIYNGYYVLSIFLPIVIALINVVVNIVIKCLNNFERNKSLSKDTTGNLCKIFLLQFINGGLFILLANIKLDAVIKAMKSFPLFTGIYDDMTPSWFKKVGSMMILVMTLNIFTPHLETYIKYITNRFLRCCDSGCSNGQKTKKTKKKDYYKLYLGPVFDIDSRYASTLFTYFVTIIFGSGMPILYVYFLVYLFLSYIIDKGLTVCYYRTPPVFDLEINNTFLNYGTLGIIIHFLISIWLYGNPKYFADEFPKGSVNGFANQIKSRLTVKASLFVAAFGILLLFVRICKGCGCCCFEEEDYEYEYYEEESEKYKKEKEKKLKEKKEVNEKKQESEEEEQIKECKVQDNVVVELKEEDFYRGLENNIEIGFAITLKDLAKYYTIKKLEYFQIILHPNTDSVKYYRKNIMYCLMYLRKFIIYRVKLATNDSSLIELLKEDFDKYLNRAMNEISYEDSIFHGDISYNLALIPKYSSSAIREYLEMAKEKHEQE